MINIVAVICLLPILGISGASLPSFIKVCKREADMFPCLKENVEICRPLLNKGIPELHIPVLEPFVLPKIVLERNDFVFQVTEYIIEGLQQFELLAMDFKLDSDFNLHLAIKLPVFISRGEYSIKGKILMLELNGHGPGRANATDLKATLDITGSKVTKKGQEYAKINDGKINLEFDGPIFTHFEKLFGDRDDLTEATNQVIQENVIDFVKELQPVIEDLIISIVMGVIKPLFNKYSLDELFPK